MIDWEHVDANRRLDRVIALGWIGGTVAPAVARLIRGKSLEELRRSAVDVLGPHGEVLVRGFNYVEPRGILKW